MTKLTPKQVLRYYHNKQIADAIIKDEASKRGQIIHGTRALNQQVPTYLKRKTLDYDVYTKKAKSSAQRVAEKLNIAYGRDEFEVVAGKHKNTWKVKSKSSGKTVADYTGQGKKPQSVNVLGVRYASSEALKSKARKLLKEESKRFRWDKDIDTLRRIKLTEEAFDW